MALIREKDLKEYNAELLTKNIQIANIKDMKDWLKNTSLPFSFSDHSQFRKVILEILVTSNNADENLKDCSKILEQLRECTLKIADIKGFHRLYMVNQSKKKFVDLNKSILDIELVGYYFEDEIVTTISGATAINLLSTADTPVKIEIDPLENILELEIVGFGEDITIKNLSEGKRVIIDGEKGLVTEEGENKFQDYDSWGFPKLSPGENKISISEDIEITVIYSPRWL